MKLRQPIAQSQEEKAESPRKFRSDCQALTKLSCASSSASSRPARCTRKARSLASCVSTSSRNAPLSPRAARRHRMASASDAAGNVRLVRPAEQIVADEQGRADEGREQG